MSNNITNRRSAVSAAIILHSLEIILAIDDGDWWSTASFLCIWPVNQRTASCFRQRMNNDWTIGFSVGWPQKFHQTSPKHEDTKLPNCLVFAPARSAHSLSRDDGCWTCGDTSCACGSISTSSICTPTRRRVLPALRELRNRRCCSNGTRVTCVKSIMTNSDQRRRDLIVRW